MRLPFYVKVELKHLTVTSKLQPNYKTTIIQSHLKSTWMVEEAREQNSVISHRRVAGKNQEGYLSWGGPPWGERSLSPTPGFQPRVPVKHSNLHLPNGQGRIPTRFWSQSWKKTRSQCSLIEKQPAASVLSCRPGWPCPGQGWQKPQF